MQSLLSFLFSTLFFVSSLTTTLHYHDEQESTKLHQACQVCIKVSQFNYDVTGSDLSDAIEASFLFLVAESYQTLVGHTYQSLLIQPAPRGPPAHC
ncbi:hypothetical protein ABMA75_04970 [Halobacteriovorax sp. ZH4_bin.1]|uniref:hypothetical protein n=2 Tax=Halobacteriovorax TaxID=1652133 RepID=UPI0037236401